MGLYSYIVNWMYPSQPDCRLCTHCGRKWCLSIERENNPKINLKQCPYCGNDKVHFYQKPSWIYDDIDHEPVIIEKKKPVAMIVAREPAKKPELLQELKEAIQKRQERIQENRLRRSGCILCV